MWYQVLHFGCKWYQHKSPVRVSGHSLRGKFSSLKGSSQCKGNLRMKTSASANKKAVAIFVSGHRDSRRFPTGPGTERFMTDLIAGGSTIRRAASLPINGCGAAFFFADGVGVRVAQVALSPGEDERRAVTRLGNPIHRLNFMALFLHYFFSRSI